MGGKKKNVAKSILKEAETIQVPPYIPACFPSGVPKNWESLRGCCLYIATPAYGGMFFSHYVSAIQQVAIQATLLGVQYNFFTIGNESLITRARNRAVAHFLHATEKADHKRSYLLFIDADIGFSPEAVWRIMLNDKEVCGAIYPKKDIPWEAIKRVSKEYPDITAEDLELVCKSYNLNLSGDETPLEKEMNTQSNLLSVENIATGFMCIRRDVFTKLMKEYPDLQYNGLVENQSQPELEHYWWLFFDCRLSKNLKRYLSEDWAFCSLCRGAGIRIYADIAIPLSHTGTYCWTGWVGAMFDQYMTDENLRKIKLK